MRIIFFGSFGKFSKMYLDSLKNAGFEISLTVEDKNVNFEDIKNEIIKIRPDFGVIAYFGKIIPEKILTIPKKGFINTHPSLLPRWRGPSPVQNTILANDKTTGITIHLTSAKVDAGYILEQKEIPVLPNDTCHTLTERLAQEGAELLVKTIPKWIEGKITPIIQDESKATYTKIIKKKDGLIDWLRSPEYIERMVRAYDPWPSAYTYAEIKRQKSKVKIMVKIKKVQIENGKLKILVVQPEGKKEMPYEAFLRGHSNFQLPV